MFDHEKKEVLVLGIGNILWADEGFGVRCVEAFHQRFHHRDDIAVIDGGTLGYYLMNELIGAKRLLLFDCCDLKAEPGTLKVLRDDDIKAWSATKISPHQTGMNDLLASVALQGFVPEKLTVIGVQPNILDDYGGSLSDLVRPRVGEALALARKELQAWGFELVERDPAESVPPLASSSLELTPYETQRPSEDSACRTGDERFLAQGPVRAEREE